MKVVYSPYPLTRVTLIPFTLMLTSRSSTSPSTWVRTIATIFLNSMPPASMQTVACSSLFARPLPGLRKFAIAEDPYVILPAQANMAIALPGKYRIHISGGCLYTGAERLGGGEDQTLPFGVCRYPGTDWGRAVVISRHS